MDVSEADREDRCAVEVTVGLIAGKWKPIILFHLHMAGRLRFAELGRKLPRVSDRVLARTLRELEADGLVARMVESTMPVRVSYDLTEDGRSLVPLLRALSAWANGRAVDPVG
jgi:DNA-binding HxlR family transcriptional regulator